MKKLVIANWKANKDLNEAREWLAVFNREVLPDNVTTVVCPSFPLLKAFEGVPFSLGVQDISHFETGPHTGEVAASQVSSLVEYSLVGHSERRREEGETNEMVIHKAELALAQGLHPIICVSEISQVEALKQGGLADGSFTLAYEPLDAISTTPGSHVDDSLDILNFIKQVAAVFPKSPVIYGGSVDPDNVATFAKLPEVAGVLVGGASLDPIKFLAIIKTYATY